MLLLLQSSRLGLEAIWAIWMFRFFVDTVIWYFRILICIFYLTWVQLQNLRITIARLTDIANPAKRPSTKRLREL